MESKEPRIYSFNDRLVVKLIGKPEWIQRFIILLRKIYSPEYMNFSPILKNRGSEDTYHCFVNILMDNPSPNEEVDE